jgi:hypothetical protein
MQNFLELAFIHACIHIFSTIALCQFAAKCHVFYEFLSIIWIHGDQVVLAGSFCFSIVDRIAGHIKASDQFPVALLKNCKLKLEVEHCATN